MFDVGVGPDLIHLETTISPFTPFWKYHPPLPTFRLDVSDANGRFKVFGMSCTRRQNGMSMGINFLPKPFTKSKAR